MLKFVVSTAVVLLASAGSAGAQSKIQTGPIQRTSVTNPKEMFDSYCAVCHGKDARGNGPATPALKTAPADLTKISSRNGGTFPEIRVRRFIAGLDEVPAHGSRAMPVWGPLFRSLSPDTAELRVVQLSDYLKSLQQ